MRITNIRKNTKIRTFLQSVWNQRRKLHYFTIGYKKSNLQKNYIKI